MLCTVDIVLMFHSLPFWRNIFFFFSIDPVLLLSFSSTLGLKNKDSGERVECYYALHTAEMCYAKMFSFFFCFFFSFFLLLKIYSCCLCELNKWRASVCIVNIVYSCNFLFVSATALGIQNWLSEIMMAVNGRAFIKC